MSRVMRSNASRRHGRVASRSIAEGIDARPSLKRVLRGRPSRPRPLMTDLAPGAAAATPRTAGRSSSKRAYGDYPVVNAFLDIGASPH
jgi:hypothetical protein